MSALFVIQSYGNGFCLTTSTRHPGTFEPERAITVKVTKANLDPSCKFEGDGEKKVAPADKPHQGPLYERFCGLDDNQSESSRPGRMGEEDSRAVPSGRHRSPASPRRSRHKAFGAPRVELPAHRLIVSTNREEPIDDRGIL
jgi:hypothetical protein